MKLAKKFLFFFTLTALTLGCIDVPSLEDTPTLKFISVSKPKMNQGRINQDSIIITLEFTDGDGDIGFIENGERKPDLFVTDLRTGNQYDTFIIPSIPQQGANNGILGTMRIKLYTQCCTQNPCSPDIDQADEALPLEIYIVDRAQHKSNVVTVTGLALKCF